LFGGIDIPAGSNSSMHDAAGRCVQFDMDDIAR